MSVKYQQSTTTDMSDEFRCCGLTVPRLAIYGGGLLVLWGIGAYFGSGQASLTAMIPSFMGAPLLLLGILSERKPEHVHHFMHAAMFVALVMVAGGARVFSGMDEMSNLAISSHFALIIVGVCFMVAGIKSFRHARLARQEE